MGICLQYVNDDGPVMKGRKTLKLENGFIWMVGRRDPIIPPGATKANWHIQGVASSEIIAIEMCLDDTYFIGPLPINTALPHDTIEWIGLYFPLGPNPHNTTS